MPTLTQEPAYCSILARNYLPKALALATSLERHHPGARLVMLLIDVPTPEELPDPIPGLPGVEFRSTAELGLTRREVMHFATIYELVEFATAVKPLLLKALLAQNEQVVYLDPDTWVTSPMDELVPGLAESEGGILLTPHFLDPVPENAEVTEGHMLTCGVYNLGFLAIDQRTGPFLDWWWGHLRTECLFEATSGLFVDQKWIDIGQMLFNATALRHRGYNTSVVNAHERPLAFDSDGVLVRGTEDRLRLFHFHGFDTNRPERITTRFSFELDERLLDVLEHLRAEYAETVLKFVGELGEAPRYPYFDDTEGRPVTKLLRRAYRAEWLEGDESLPLPFAPEDAAAWTAWRKRAWKRISRELAGDVAKMARVSMPEHYERAKARFPQVTDALRGRFVSRTGLWK